MLAVVNNATINSSVLTALWASVLVFFRQIWEELLDHMVVLCLIFLRKLHTVPQITILIYVPTDCAQGFPFPHISLQHLLCIVIVIIAILKDEMIAHCGFDSHFWDGYRLKNPFMCLSAICIVFLEKCLFMSSIHFAIWLFLWYSGMWASYTLGILNSYWAFHLQIFSIIFWLLCIPSMV